MVHHQVDQQPHATLLAAVTEGDEIPQRAIARVDAVVIGDVVAIVAVWRGLKRHQPDGGDAEPLQIIEPAGQPGKITDAVAVGIHEGLDGQAVDDRVLVPEVVDHRVG